MGTLGQFNWRRYVLLTSVLAIIYLICIGRILSLGNIGLYLLALRCISTTPNFELISGVPPSQRTSGWAQSFSRVDVMQGWRDVELRLFKKRQWHLADTRYNIGDERRSDHDGTDKELN
jgi:hypothetical protein